MRFSTILYIFLFVLSFEIQAQVMGVAIASAEIKKYDLNKDGKIDRVEYYKDDKLIRVEEDRNSDEKYDYAEIHDDTIFYLIIEQDTNFDGKVDFIKSYTKFKKTYSKIKTAIDRDSDGFFETSFTEVIDDRQKDTECARLSVADEIANFATFALRVSAQIPNGFTPTGAGVKIENECLKRWGNSFQNTVKESVKEGMQCLGNLPRPTNGSISGAQRNIFGLNQLFRDDKISLVCSDKSYDWKETAAYASTNKTEIIKGKNIAHPYVVLNPGYPKNASRPTGEETKKIKATIFHEMLHNLGYRHSESIEFSYACSACCYNNGETKEAKAIACKICTGNYKNELDPKYLEDFVEFGKENFKEEFALDTVLRFSKLQAKSLDSISLISEASSGVFNPIGPELAKLVQAQKSGISPAVTNRLNSARTYENMNEFKTSKKTNEVLAKSFYELYYNHDGVKSVALLNQNKEAIKREIAALKRQGKNSKWVAQELEENLDKLIFEMWINEFPNKKASDQAYDLKLYFEKK